MQVRSLLYSASAIAALAIMGLVPANVAAQATATAKAVGQQSASCCEGCGAYAESGGRPSRSNWGLASRRSRCLRRA